MRVLVILALASAGTAFAPTRPRVIHSKIILKPSPSDNHADQMNPNNDAYWDSRGEDGRPDDWEDIIDDGQSQEELDNHANQMNPNNDAYWSSRGD